ncbi:hypothetical protein [Salarchaeum japonicum]|uniref:Uncharacterized protein n=1 Tax=Salarchaeum japonicum TaxID=555573 RepID=A0AAV3T0J7_9EURY|nr:hypothetical protein [Salarchaeum japonicum]
MRLPTRRALLTALGAGAAGALAGCQTATDSREPPVGSLGFKNRHRLPHTLGVELTDTAGSDQGRQPVESTVSLRPGEAVFVPSVFTEETTYTLSFTVDGDPPEREDARTMAFEPYGKDDSWVSLVVEDTGAFSWYDVSTRADGGYDL